MSICRGIAGNRGRSPQGIFIHNDAGSQNANTGFYKNWLQTHNLENGFAHYYVANDGILQAEDDGKCAWHCGQTDGNTNYLSIEVCQSMGELNNFKKNEEKALQLAAQKCKQYGIVPSNSTIRLHQEVYATSCPHRSVEIHGGAMKTKSYFISQIKQYMGEEKKVMKQTPGNAVNNNGLYYRTHVQDLGWLDPVHDGQVSGTTGYGKQVEALKIDTRKLPGVTLNVKAHIQDIGWKLYKNIRHDIVIGTVGKNKRIEAIEIEASGLPAGKKLLYRTHSANVGWTGWIEAGFTTGSVGMKRAIEAIQIKITP